MIFPVQITRKIAKFANTPTFAMARKKKTLSNRSSDDDDDDVFSDDPKMFFKSAETRIFSN